MSAEANHKPWNTPDFELKFREAMGRDMTRQEREFFGLMDEDATNDEDAGRTNPGPKHSEFSWHSLQRISPLVGS